MQKKFLAVAVALVSIPALGQLSMYGTVDVAVQKLDLGQRADGKEVSELRLTSGMLSSPRFGIKGEQPLGIYGLQVGFQLETGFVLQGGGVFENASNFNSAYMYPQEALRSLFSRQARLYLSGHMGELSFGRQMSPMYFVMNEMDPSHGGLSLTSSNLFHVTPYSLFVDNSIGYHTPEYNGLSACFLVGLAEATFPMTAAQDAVRHDEAGQVLSAALEYASGPLYVGFGYVTENRASFSSVSILEPAYTNQYVVGASYDFGVAKPYVSYFSGRKYDAMVPAGLDSSGNPLPNPTDHVLATDATVVSFGASVPVGEYGYVLANFGALTNHAVTDGGAYLFGVGYAYSFNRNATVYAAYTKLTNTLTTGGPGAGLTLHGALRNGPTMMPDVKGDPQSIEIGFRYRF